MMDDDVRGVLWDINYALNGKEHRTGPTSYTTYGYPTLDAATNKPDRFAVYRDGRWFEISARPLEPHEAP